MINEFLRSLAFYSSSVNWYDLLFPLIFLQGSSIIITKAKFSHDSVNFQFSISNHDVSFNFWGNSENHLIGYFLCRTFVWLWGKLYRAKLLLCFVSCLFGTLWDSFQCAMDSKHENSISPLRSSVRITLFNFTPKMEKNECFFSLMASRLLQS